MTVVDRAPGDSLALLDAASGASVSFAELRARAASVIGPVGGTRELVLLLTGNDLFSVLVYAGVTAAGHPVVLLDAQARDDVLAGMLGAYRPRWVSGPVGTSARLAATGIDVADVHTCEGGEVLDLGLPGPEVHADLSVLLTTSGTTGSRKLVRLSTANVESNADSIAELLGLGPTERPITSLPIHYSFGLSVLNSHWLAGAAVVLTAESVLQKQFWAQATEHGATSLAGVPFTFQMLERAGFRTMDLPALTTLQQAGGALDRRLTDLYGGHMSERGGRLVVMYGQTEATARMAYVPPDQLAAKAGSAGIAVPGGRLSIDADHPGAVGEVVYTGPNVMMGYAEGHAELARGDDLGGTLRTGDLGHLDEDGFLFLTGRSARMAKVFGLRLNLDDVEAALREGGPAAAVGGTDLVWGFCAFGTEESLAEDARALARRYRIHHGAIRLQRVDEIPTTSSGKTDYEAVRRWTT